MLKHFFMTFACFKHNLLTAQPLKHFLKACYLRLCCTIWHVKGAHHLDLMWSHPNDPASVRSARHFEVNQIADWIRNSVHSNWDGCNWWGPEFWLRYGRQVNGCIILALVGGYWNTSFDACIHSPDFLHIPEPYLKKMRCLKDLVPRSKKVLSWMNFECWLCIFCPALSGTSNLLLCRYVYFK